MRGLSLTSRHNSDDSPTDRSENLQIRRFIPLLAAVALIAPSCPRDYGPGDYDPDATRSFTPGADVEDLVYVSAGSAKGDSDYVVAMPRGDTIARIDGPDRRGWVFASATLAYYPVMRREYENTIHRIDLRTGARARIVTDSRPGMQFLYEWGPEFTALALTTDDPEPDKYQLRMWISDDRRRLPLRLTCTTKLGPLRADLAILPTAVQ